MSNTNNTKPATLRTAKKAVRIYCEGLNTKIDQNTITIWVGLGLTADRAEFIAKSVAAECYGAELKGSATKWVIFYRTGGYTAPAPRREPECMSDPNYVGHPMHY